MSLKDKDKKRTIFRNLFMFLEFKFLRKKLSLSVFLLQIVFIYLFMFSQDRLLNYVKPSSMKALPTFLAKYLQGTFYNYAFDMYLV